MSKYTEIVAELNRLEASNQGLRKIADRLDAQVEHGEILSTTDTIMVSKAELRAIAAELREAGE